MKTTTTISKDKVREILDSMLSRPQMYSSTPGSLWEAYHALANLVFADTEEDWKIFQSIETKVNYKYKNYTNFPYAHTLEKDDFDGVVKFLREFRDELEKSLG